MPTSHITVSLLDAPAVMRFIQHVATVEERCPNMGNYEIRAELTWALERLMAEVNGTNEEEAG